MFVLSRRSEAFRCPITSPLLLPPVLGSTAKLAMPLVVFNEMNWFRALSCTPPLASATSSPLPPAGALFCVERKRRATPVGAWLMTASSQKPPGSRAP